MSWIDDDVCWCGNECDKLDCWRNPVNRSPRPGVYTMALLKGTNICPLSYKESEFDEEEE